MDLDHNQRSQSLTDATVNVKNRYRWRKLSKLYWTARKEMEDISLKKSYGGSNEKSTTKHERWYKRLNCHRSFRVMKSKQ
jgi:hypothetical protein